MSRFYYRNNIEEFLAESTDSVLGKLARNNGFALEEQQRNSWITQIDLLKVCLKDTACEIIFEYSIPRMGKRIDCVIISGATIFSVEFKVGSKSYENAAITQVTDYALDLKNFHEQSHKRKIVPILICTKAADRTPILEFYSDGIAKTLLTNGASLSNIISIAQTQSEADKIIVDDWLSSIYKPTPTII